MAIECSIAPGSVPWVLTVGVITIPYVVTMPSVLVITPGKAMGSTARLLAPVHLIAMHGMVKVITFRLRMLGTGV